ncbi:MAG: hypothetical protein ACQEP6_01570 [Patescibacteria group bacterium]
MSPNGSLWQGEKGCSLIKVARLGDKIKYLQKEGSLMDGKILVVFLLLITAVASFYYFKVIYEKPASARFDVSVFDAGQNKTGVLAFIQIKALLPNIKLEEIKKRADKEAQKLGGKAKITEVFSTSYQKSSGWYFFGTGNVNEEMEVFHSAMFMILQK